MKKTRTCLAFLGLALFIALVALAISLVPPPTLVIALLLIMFGLVAGIAGLASLKP